MKKSILVILGAIAITIVLGGVLLFIGNSATSSNGIVTVDLNGTWYVYQYGSDIVENEIMVFSDGNVFDYRDDSDSPAITSTYTYTSDGILNMHDVSREFTVRIVSENNIILIEPNTIEWKLVRIADPEQKIEEVTNDKLQGQYIVKMVAGEVRTNEEMIFTENQLTDVRDGEEYISCSYEMRSGHLLYAIELSKEYTVFINGTTAMMIDKAANYVWELVLKTN